MERRRISVALAVAVVMGVIAFSWPLFLRPESGMSPTQAPIMFALALAAMLAVVLSEVAGGRMDARTLAMLGVLAAVGTVLRPLSAGTAGFELIFFLMILAGRVFGAGFGFALGAITLFTSALITSGVGPWLPYQMLSAGFVGLFAGLLPKAKGWAEIWLLAGYGMVSAFAYGWVMDFSFWPYGIGNETQISFDASLGALENLHRFVLYNIATSMGWNLGRALTNAALIMLLGVPLLRILRRAARPAVFAEDAATPEPTRSPSARVVPHAAPPHLISEAIAAPTRPE
ncbi:energy-coupling factor transport system substrate-specific component [Propionicimonas paludicola]|uniref:Energy-coupling factor transport system substrate-specific component n=1 Tax=Propionicimonas paludicola TaxID=185243 RepID=A0A2A9CTQ8_9ACTN|nr:ECF transporter S component [Propionicimonas paludicola]PFG17531.1 energy-coupling factor transport system substrate-specific component [Propionicimonas paludicola]